ncbi:hypothetical protein [Paludisphaera mucosa]|uniref:Uncharacterized protein n=1 Tax=Paludisphaera mucosa TaxID=3030827 RepID=A0ABT6FEI1_9BACT|nr:hypothetical protein [Paludisphaera mucosa]MDG3005986.1 hypothetical protein [Paludisphaera mucosa]
MSTASRKAGTGLPSVLATIAIALAAAVAGCSQAGGGASADGREAAASFLDALRAGRVEDAWRDTSPEFKSLMGLDSLRDLVKRRPALKTATRRDGCTAVGEGRSLFEHAFQGATTHRGKTTPATIKVLVAPDDDGWKVEGLVVE